MIAWTINTNIWLREVATVEAPFNRCVECDEVITNPLCSECLAERMRLVISEHDPILAEQIHGLPIDGNTSCISCGKNMGLCAHCFSRDVYDYIHENNPSLAEEFLSRFDFDLRREL